MPADPLFDRLTRALAGRYTLIRELGQGGMATVYLATDVKLGRRVAIKVLPPTTRAYLGSGRFQREVLFAAQLSHPNIVPLFEADEADELLFYVMEYVEGDSLKDRLARDGPLAVDEALRIAAEVGDALEYAHETGVVHRDIKPGNILLSRGHAMVSDFGIAKVVAESGAAADRASITGTGVTVGTAEYMSPEQASGEKRVDARSDVYALAAVLYEMLAGEPPFTGPSVQAIIARVLSDPPPPIRTLRPSLPAHAEAALPAGPAKLPGARAPAGRALRSRVAPPPRGPRGAAPPLAEAGRGRPPARRGGDGVGGRRPPPAPGERGAGRHGPRAPRHLPRGRWPGPTDNARRARLLLHRLDPGHSRSLRAVPACHPRFIAMDPRAARDLARHRRTLGRSAGLLPIARSCRAAPHGSGVGGGGRRSEPGRVSVGQRLGGRACQRGRGDRHPQAGRLVPAGALGRGGCGPDRQRLGMGRGRDPGVERPGSACDQGRRLRHTAQERIGFLTELGSRGPPGGLEHGLPVRAAEVRRG